MITYQRESISAVKDEIAPLLREHWEEIALDRDTVPLDPDWDAYQHLDEYNMLYLMTARSDGVLVGYIAYFITGNLHYRSLRVADHDVYWLHPDYRKGMTGLRLFKEAEVELRALGVNRIVNKVKLHHDVGRLFERMGYRATERVYVKNLEG